MRWLVFPFSGELLGLEFIWTHIPPDRRKTAIHIRALHSPAMPELWGGINHLMISCPKPAGNVTFVEGGLYKNCRFWHLWVLATATRYELARAKTNGFHTLELSCICFVLLWLPVQALLGTASTVAVPAVFVSIFKGEWDFSWKMWRYKHVGG